MEQEPRHFWRRFAASIVDLTLIAFLTFFLYLPLTALFPNQFQIASGPISSTICFVPSAPPVTFMSAAPQDFFPKDATIQFQLCEVTSMFMIKSYIGKASGSSSSDDETVSSYTLSYSAATDANGNPIPGTDYQSVIVLAGLIFAIAAILKLWSGKTVGKKILGIRVSADQETDFKLYAKREALKYLPLLLMAAVGVPLLSIDALFGTSFSTDLVSKYPFLLVGFFLIILVIDIFWYILPLIRWRGQMPYDRLTGFKVIKD